MDKNSLKYLVNVCLLLIGYNAGQVLAQIPTRTGPAAADVIQKARSIVEANMDSLNAHKKYIYAMGIKNPQLIDQYKMWNEVYPKNKAIPLSIGTVFSNAGMSEASDFLLKAADIDPENANVWVLLSGDATARGHEELAIEYMRKAAMADPSDAGYAYGYLRSFKNGDSSAYKEKVFDFVRRFPESKYGAQALYWLGVSTTDIDEKVYYYEELRKLYPPQKFDFSASGMTELADIYLQIDVEKALTLTNQMGEKGNWKIRKELAEALVDINSLEQSNKYADAITKLDQVRLPKFNYISDFIELKKSYLREKSGDVNGAYDSLAVKFAKLPSDALYSALESLGKKLGKDKRQIAKDIEVIKDSAAIPAYPFELGLYSSNDTLSLNALKGKVILLTFWFPGCGPCREEFPHFQAVVNSFEGDSLIYLGINVYPLQDGYVLPFIENNKYSFTPLRGNQSFASDKYGVEAYPTNFLIDKDGKIVFRDFRIDQTNHRTLELMISSLLEKGQAKQ